MLTTDQVARILRVTPQRVRALCQQRRLPAQKVGRDWLIEEKDVRAYRPGRVGRPRKA